MSKKLKAHLLTLPRWFALPFFGSSILLGAVLAKGLNLNAWLGLIAGLLVMAGGHAFNSFLDYAWTGLDKGTPEEKSAAKGYTGGQSLIPDIISAREAAINGLVWYALSIIPVAFLVTRTGWPILIPWILGMLITFWYVKAKFNWTHELALGTGVGPIAVLLGMYAVSANPPWVTAIIVGVPVAIILSFAGLALDEWPDAEANLKKGVKSLAYMVWKYSEPDKIVPELSNLKWYLSTWLLFMMAYHVFLISVGMLHALSALAFLSIPGMIGCMVMLPADFKKVAKVFVAVAAFYPVFLLVGQILGG